MIIAMGNRLEEMAARAILGQDEHLRDVLEGMYWQNKEYGKPLSLLEFAQTGDYVLCGPSRNAPKGFIYNPKSNIKDILQYQGQLFVGRNLITMQDVRCSALRSGEVSAVGETEAVVPIFGANPRLRKHLVGAMIKILGERFDVRSHGELIYDKYIIYESSEQKQLVQDILNGK